MKSSAAHSPADSARNHPAEIQALVSTGDHAAPGQSKPGDKQLLLEQKFLALNQLSGGIAHEFNNIIAGILGSAELIAMDIHEHHPAHESLKHIFEASNRARDFLHKIRAFSLRPPVERKPISLQPVIEESIHLLRGVIPEKAALQARLSPDCPKVNADAAQIHQVLLDLCLHCWQGLHERRGHITITLENGAPPKKLSALLPEKIVCLTVRDDSQGLDPHALEKIFDPFHTRKSSAKKIGLELFLARETIHAHQGEIVAESKTGHGLAFHIYLPVAA